MSGIRQKIAQRLVEAQQTAAILTTFNEADMSRVMELRAQYKETFQKQHGVGARLHVVLRQGVDRGPQGVPRGQRPDRGQRDRLPQLLRHRRGREHRAGLMVPGDPRRRPPVLRGDREGHRGVRRQGPRGDDRGRRPPAAGTFTITNGGIFGSLLSTPILNPPQSGILGMHAIKKRPVAVDDQVVDPPDDVPGPLLRPPHHRRPKAVSFLVRVKECIENPERLMLEI